MKGTIVDRFMNKIVVDWNTGCWEWTGGTSRGYGTFFIGKLNGKSKFIGAHVFSYEYFNAMPVPIKKELDHLCSTPQCVNPDHLDAVSHRTNMLRGKGPISINAAKTSCPKGHPLSGENIYNVTRGDRICKICNWARRRKQ